MNHQWNEPVNSAYILPIKTPLDPPFFWQIQNFLAQAQDVMPTVHQAAVLQAAAGGRADQQVVAKYAIGLVWLSWRYNRALHLLESAVNASGAYIASNRYLKLQQELGLLKFLPLFAEPRAQAQPLEQLHQEARLIAYLTTGR
jgi:hypothetical protein